MPCELTVAGRNYALFVVKSTGAPKWGRGAGQAKLGNARMSKAPGHTIPP